MPLKPIDTYQSNMRIRLSNKDTAEKLTRIMLTRQHRSPITMQGSSSVIKMKAY